MEIIIAENAGSCWGVNRSLRIAFESVKGNLKNIYSFGPLIHNPQVVSKLEERGIKVVGDIESINGGSVIIRTHGIPPSIRDKLSQKKINLIDATCPIVARSQKIAKSLSEDGYKVIIIGEKNHPEVI